MKLFQIRAESIFLVFAVAFGALFWFITPPLGAPDEHVHFYRAYAISNGDFFEVPLNNGVLGNLIPRSVAELATHFGNPSRFHPTPRLVGEYAHTPLNPSDKVEVPFPSGATYSPTAYLPQTIAICIAKSINLSALKSMYAARLLNLLFWVSFVFFAICRMPKRLKLLAAVIALTPMAVAQAATVSPDAMNNSLSFYIIACFVAWKSFGENRVIGLADMLFYILATVLLVLCKMNILCPFLVLLVPSARFGGGRRKVLFVLAVAAAVVFCVWLYGRFVFHPLPPAKFEKAQWLKHSPLQFTILVARTTAVMFRTYLGEYIGIFGYRDLKMPVFVYLVYIAALFMALLTTRFRAGNPARAVAVVIFFVFYFSLHAGLFVDWTPMNSPIVTGVQGRYFLPLAALLLLFPVRHAIPFRTNAKFVRLAIVACLLFVFTFSIARVFRAWYAPVPVAAAAMAASAGSHSTAK